MVALMNGRENVDAALRKYHDTTTAKAPPGFRDGVLAKLEEIAPGCPQTLALMAILSTALLTAVLSLLMTSNVIQHQEKQPPSFLQDIGPDSWLSAP
jgi:hypothetical protein